MRLASAFLIPLLLVMTACAVGQSSSATAAVGDPCLVGSWTMVDEKNSSGYTFANAPVAVEGLRGTRLTISSAGDEREDFTDSAPLVGMLTDGRALAITIRGSFDFRIVARGGTYTETGTETALPTTASVAGIPITDYHSDYTPGAGTYSCSSTSLTMTTNDAVQTATWSKT